jgi:hypothetical protein
MHSTNSNQVLPHTLEMHSTNSNQVLPHTLEMHSTNSNQVLPHTLEMHSTNSNQVLPHTLEMHSANSNQVLYKSNVHKYTLMIQIKTYNVGMCTHAHLMLQNTSKEHQSRTCAPPSSKWLAKPESSSKALQKSSKAPKAPPKPSKRANLHL